MCRRRDGVRFYTQAFGLTVGRRFGKDFVSCWDGGNGLPADEGSRHDRAGGDKRRYSPTGRPSIPTSSWTTWTKPFERAVAEGAILEARPRIPPMDGRHARRPFGHGFCLLQFNARGYDALTAA